MALRSDIQHWLAQIAFALAFIAMAGIGFAYVFSSAPDAAPICARATQFEANPRFCAGIIDWLGDPASRNTAVVLEMLRDIDPMRVLFSAILTILPFSIACWHSAQRWKIIFACVLALITLTPLYAIAKDWGRWFSMDSIGLSFVFISAVIWRRSRVEFIFYPLNPIAILVMTILSLTLAPLHYTGEISRGLIWSFKEQLDYN